MLSPALARPLTWRVLEGVTAVMMTVLAVSVLCLLMPLVTGRNGHRIIAVYAPAGRRTIWAWHPVPLGSGLP